MTWQQKALLVGVLMGSLAGLGAALLYIRSVQDTGQEQPHKISTGDALKVGFGVFALIRQVSSLGK